jgi:hypothetical protein
MLAIISINQIQFAKQVSLADHSDSWKIVSRRRFAVMSFSAALTSGSFVHTADIHPVFGRCHAATGRFERRPKADVHSLV